MGNSLYRKLGEAVKEFPGLFVSGCPDAGFLKEMRGLTQKQIICIAVNIT